MTNKFCLVWKFIRSYCLVPFIALFLTLLSFAILSSQLGFYLDDWPQLYSLIKQGSNGISEYFLYDGRPFGFWPDLFFYSLWGTDALGWHLTNFLLRWVVGVLFWLTLCQLWPKHHREASWAAFLFCVFPLFNQQSMGLTFIAHWTCFVLFMASIFLMVLAVKRKRLNIFLLILSLLIDIPNLFTYENFIGVEFLRPIILWFAFSDEVKSKIRLKRILLTWLPFLLLACLYIYWRLFAMENLREDTSPTLLYQFGSDPLTAIVTLVNFFLKDVFYMILNVWYPTFSVDQIDLFTPSTLLSLFLSLLIAIILIVLLFIEKRKISDNGSIVEDHFAINTTILGLAGIILGCAPAWIIMRSVSDSGGIWNDRFGLPAMFGASLFIVGITRLLFSQSRLKSEIIFAILIGFAVGHNFSVTNDYRWASISANRFFSQLTWRVPYLESGSAILADNEMLPKMGVYPTSFAINLLYPTAEDSPKLDYWFFTIYKYFPNQINVLEKGIPIHQGHWYSTFDGDSQNSIVIGWQPGTSQCVWVLTKNDRMNPYLSVNTVNALGASNLSRIKSDSNGINFSEQLFGSQNKNTWCYYYEKADLARQQRDWNTVVSLYSEAVSHNLKPSFQNEMMPFIEAKIHTGDLEGSIQLTKEAAIKDDKLQSFFCDNWKRISVELNSNPDIQSAYDLISTHFGCVELLSGE